MICLKETKTEDEILWESYKDTGDIKLRNKLVEKYIYLVKIIALKLRGTYQKHADVDDIINEGIIVLIDAIDRYDMTKNVKFETYASIRLRGSVIDYIRKQDFVPRRVKKNTRTIEDAANELHNSLGRLPSDNEVSSYLGIDIDEYNDMLRESYSASILSFEEVIGESASVCINQTNSFVSPEDDYEKNEMIDILSKGIESLSEKEKIIVSLYYKEEVKLKDIAKILNITTSRASQLHSSALSKLKLYINQYS